MGGQGIDQLPAQLLGGRRLAVVLAGFAFNMVQAGFFRRYGFLTAIIVRVAFYLIWHVAYVH
jgi:hypothetical protein